MSQIQIINQTLPSWVASELAHAPSHTRDLIMRELSDMGWTLTAIADAAKLTRERVRQVCARLQLLGVGEIPTGLPLPTPPMKPEKLKPEYVEPSQWVLERLLELQPFAQRVRSSSPKFRKEAEEYTALIHHAHTVEGVPLYRLAKRLGVTHGALRFRLARYGYLESSGTSDVYAPVTDANRYGR